MTQVDKCRSVFVTHSIPRGCRVAMPPTCSIYNTRNVIL